MLNNQQLPTLKFENQIYKTDESKANLFGSILSKTFSFSVDSKFDEVFRAKVEKTISEFNFKKTDLEIFKLQDLNLVIKNLKKKFIKWRRQYS